MLEVYRPKLVNQRQVSSLQHLKGEMNLITTEAEVLEEFVNLGQKKAREQVYTTRIRNSH